MGLSLCIALRNRVVEALFTARPHIRKFALHIVWEYVATFVHTSTVTAGHCPIRTHGCICLRFAVFICGRPRFKPCGRLYRRMLFRAAARQKAGA
jgi:hypothetical protein